MRKSRLLLFVAILLLSSECARDETVVLPDLQESSDTSLSLDEARSEVELLMGQIDGGTRVAGSRRICDYYCLGRESVTRSDALPANEVPMTYIFNFEDNEGFAIVAGDKRILSPILAVTDKGYLDPGKGVDNPGLIVFLSLAEEYCASEIAKYQEEQENLLGGTRITGGYTDTEWVGDWQVTGLLGRRTYLNWGQQKPFNDNLPPHPQYAGIKSSAGCVAIATMLLMAWHKHPRIYAGYWYNWTEIVKQQNIQKESYGTLGAVYADLARLTEIVTRPVNLWTNFSNGGTVLEYIPRTLKNLGYSSGGRCDAWNLQTVEANFKNAPHSPVAISAYAVMTSAKRGSEASKLMGIRISGPWLDPNYNYSNGHAFLLESAMTRKRMLRYINLPQYRWVNQTLFYTNFGWYGMDNGYYNGGVFGTATGPVVKSTSKTRGQSYRYGILAIYGVQI